MQEKEFLQLIKAHEGRLFRIAWAIVGVEEDARDILQETVERSWYCRHQLRGGAKAFPAWIQRMLVNCSINWLRKRQHEVIVDPTDHSTWHHYYPLDASNETKDLWDALRALPYEQRQTLVLKFMADLTLSQIARALGEPVGTIKSRYARALAAMRCALGSNQVTNEEVQQQ